MIHLTPQQLSSYMDGELNEVSTELVRRHMGVCEECTLKFAALEEQEEQLSHALVHEPGDDFFDRFAAEVGRQLPGGKERRGSSSPASRAAAIREAAREAPREVPPGLAAPSAPAAASAPAALSAPAAPTPLRESKSEPDRPGALAQPVSAPTPVEESFPMSEDSDLDADETLAALSVGRVSDERPSTSKPTPIRRPAPDPAPRSPERRAPSPPPRARAIQRPPQRPIRRPAPSIPWYAALILAVMAGAVGVVVSHTDPVSAWLDAHGLKNLFPTPAMPVATEPGIQAPPPDQSAPAQDMPDNSEGSAADDFEAPSQAAEPRDPFAGLPPAPLAQVRAAQRSKAAADAQPSADRYDAAAAEWERTIPLLRGARQQSLSRLELATSRYRAWESEPTVTRAASAAVAIRAYLAFAPQGAPRDLVRNWLQRVSH